MRPVFLFSCLAFFTTALAIGFINPSPFIATKDFSQNPIYALGSTVIIQWTQGSEGNRTSLALYQLNGTQYLLPLEHVTQNEVSSVTSFNWNVQTTKDLSVSNMFYLSIFYEGRTTSEANCRYFNITRNANNPTSTSSTSTSASTGTSTGTSTPAATVAPTPDSTASTTAYPASPPSELSTGGKAGIGIGIAAAVALGVIAGWFVFSRRKKQYVPQPAVFDMRGSSHEPVKWNQGSYQLSSESPTVPTTHELNGPAVLRVRDNSHELVKWNQESYQLSAESPTVSSTHELNGAPQ